MEGNPSVEERREEHQVDRQDRPPSGLGSLRSSRLRKVFWSLVGLTATVWADLELEVEQ